VRSALGVPSAFPAPARTNVPTTSQTASAFAAREVA
jgi:hypothetical protein